MVGESANAKQGPLLRAAHLVFPWIALLALAWVLASMWGSFQMKQQAARIAGTTVPSTTTTTTPAQPSVATTVTGLAATALQDVKLRLQPDLTSSAVATAKKGTKLAVMAKQGLFLRVKDQAGHIGWVPNDIQYLQVIVTKK